MAKAKFKWEMELNPKQKAIELATKEVIAVFPETTIKELLGIMVENEIRRVPVVSKRGRMVGIVISRSLIDFLGGGPRANIWLEGMRGDLARALALPVENVMSSHVIFSPSTATLWEVVGTLLKTGVGGVPLIGKEGKVEGIVSERDLMELIPPKTGIPVEIHMSRHPIAAGFGETLREVCKKMVSFGIRRLPVLRQGELCGIVTSMDVLRIFNSDKIYQLLLQGRTDDVFGMGVENFMSRRVLTVNHDADLGEAAKLMLEEGISGLPVLRKGRLAGVITEHDLLEWLFYTLYPRLKKK